MKKQFTPWELGATLYMPATRKGAPQVSGSTEQQATKMPRVPAAFSGLCRVKTGGLALHFELESALRESYAADIKYSKAGHSYQLVSFGQLDKKTLRQMNEALSQHAELRSQGISTKVLLDKDLKTTVSLSIRRRILRKIDRLAKLTGTSRSEAVETLAEMKIEDFIKVHRLKEGAI